MSKAVLHLIALVLVLGLAPTPDVSACIKLDILPDQPYVCYSKSIDYSLTKRPGSGGADLITALWNSANCRISASVGLETTATFDGDGGSAGVGALATVWEPDGYYYLKWADTGGSTTVLKITGIYGPASGPVGSSWTVSALLDKGVDAYFPTTHSIVWGGNATFSNQHGTSATATVTTPGENLTVTAQVSCGGPKVTSSPFNVVEVQKLQYWKDDGWQDVPDPLYVMLGTNVHFRAVPNPVGVPWPGRKPTWSGTCGVDDFGAETFITFGTRSETMNDYETVVAECGNTKTARVVVIEVVGLKFNRGGGWRHVTPAETAYKCMGVFALDTAWFGVDTIPSDAPLQPGCVQWGGAASGTSPEVSVWFGPPSYAPITVSTPTRTLSFGAMVIWAPSPPDEITYWQQNPVYALLAATLRLEQKSIDWAATAYPGGTDSVADAAMHCYWSMLMARYCSPTFSSGEGVAHEFTHLGSRPSTIMDLWNDSVGVALSAHSHGGYLDTSCCELATVYAVESGQLLFMDESGETGLLMTSDLW